MANLKKGVQVLSHSEISDETEDRDCVVIVLPILPEMLVTEGVSKKNGRPYKIENLTASLWQQKMIVNDEIWNVTGQINRFKNDL